MRELVFARAVLKRNLLKYGKKYAFFRYKKNQFGEDTEEEQPIKTLDGIFHRTTSHIDVQTSEGAKIQKKEVPFILCFYEDSTLLKLDDRVIINGLTYKVNGLDNVNQENQITDISLEVII